MMITIATTTIGVAIAAAIASPDFPEMVTGTKMKYKGRTCEIKQLVWSSVDEISQSKKKNVIAKLAFQIKL